VLPDVHGLEFAYALHELPPGRLPFRRWRWELWHGAKLEAAGWRVSERDAVRALGAHAARVAHRFFGLRPLARGTVELPEAVRPGMTLRIDAGGVAVSLRPRHLEAPVPALGT
jgi:hypothetical protein